MTKEKFRFEVHARLRRHALTRWIVGAKERVEILRLRTPAVRKRQRLVQILRDHALSVAVETGTFLGDTAAALSRHCEQVITIELHPRLAALARLRFTDNPRVSVVEGDSGLLLPKIVAELDRPTLFYLDGHYSGDGTALSAPLLNELSAIIDGAKKGSVVVIDDLRCIGVDPDYPSLTQTITMLQERGLNNTVAIDDALQFYL